jgi:hypothetical protein
MTAQIEVREETAAKLRAIADALQLSLDEYLSRIADLVALPQTNGQEKAEGLTPFELVEDLIGSVDSSLQDERPFYETATPEEWVKAFREWAASHDPNIPPLSLEDVSRDRLNEDRW